MWKQRWRWGAKGERKKERKDNSNLQKRKKERTGVREKE